MAEYEVHRIPAQMIKVQKKHLTKRQDAYENHISGCKNHINVSLTRKPELVFKLKNYCYTCYT